jgi:hypothetical protein
VSASGNARSGTSALGADDGDGARRCSSSISAGAAAAGAGVDGVDGVSTGTSRGGAVVRAVGAIRTTGGFGGGGVGSGRGAGGVSGPTSSMDSGIAVGACRGASVPTDARSARAVAWTTADVHTGQRNTRDDGRRAITAATGDDITTDTGSSFGGTRRRASLAA